MNEKIINKLTLFINFTLFLFLGIIIIVFDTNSQNMFHIITSLSITLVGIISFIINLVNKRKIKDILLSLWTYLIGLFFLKNKIKYLSLFPIIFALYMLLNGLIKFITYIVFKNEEKKNYYFVLLGSLTDFCFSYLMIRKPYQKINILTLILGIYLILYSLTYLSDFLKEIFKEETTKRKLRITPPIIFTVLIPYRVKGRLGKYLDTFKTEVKIKKEKKNIDLEIYIHVSEKDEGKVGHADFSYNGVVYSYGCYDENSKRLFKSLGEGTLFKTNDKEKYIKFCTQYSKKTIFAFGLSLNNNEKKKIEKKLKEIEEDTYPWNPNDKGKFKNTYAQNLVKKTNAKFYKFNKSSYKTYFLLSTNCVKLVDDVLGTLGSDILKINGVITPGAYYEYLEKEFKRENSKVVKKQIYQNNYL